ILLFSQRFARHPLGRVQVALENLGRVQVGLENGAESKKVAADSMLKRKNFSNEVYFYSLSSKFSKCHPVSLYNT
ncbi:MAG: hypothetical protein ACRD52_15255, partial [Candidatus Acidiferrales bacterium]